MNTENNSLEISKGQIILYQNKVEVRLDKETVWLSQAQMADLFLLKEVLLQNISIIYSGIKS